MNKVAGTLTLLLACLGFSLVSRPCRRNNAEAGLYAAIRRHPVAVLYVTRGETAHNNVCYRTRNKLQQAFAQLAKSGCYPKSAVLFASVDEAKPSGRKFLEDNGLLGLCLPGIVLFSNGVIVSDQHGPVVIRDDLTRTALRKRIDSYVQLDLAEYVEQERLCKRYEGIMQRRMHLYYSPYFSSVANPWNDYWGWPYYGMAQGNYGGNAGIVFGNGGISFFGSNY